MCSPTNNAPPRRGRSAATRSLCRRHARQQSHPEGQPDVRERPLSPATCQNAHDEAALTEYLSQLETELSSLQQGAALRGNGAQRLQHFSR